MLLVQWKLHADRMSFKNKTQRQTTTEVCFAITNTSGWSNPFPLVTLRFHRPTIWNNIEMQAAMHTRVFISQLYCPVYIHTIAHRSGGHRLSSLMENCRPLRPSLSQCQFPDDHGILHRKWFHITGEQNNTKSQNHCCMLHPPRWCPPTQEMCNQATEIKKKCKQQQKAISRSKTSNTVQCEV